MSKNFFCFYTNRNLVVKNKKTKDQESINIQRQFDCRGGYLIKIHDLINGREQGAAWALCKVDWR